MTETLTKAQKAAVEDRGGPLLVAAAAGSGKTKVLVDRLMGYLCQDRDPANVDEFLIITYTKAAASELRGKIGAKLTEVLAANPGNRHLQRQVQRLYLAKISWSCPGIFGWRMRRSAIACGSGLWRKFWRQPMRTSLGVPSSRPLWIPRALAGTTMRCRRLWRLSMRQPGAISGRMPGWRAV